MGESRMQFEKVVIERAEASNYMHMNSLLKRKGNGYSTTWVDMMWEGWQASRAAIEIEIPELKMIKDYLREVSLREREDILVGCKLEFHRKLKELGIKIKGA